MEASGHGRNLSAGRDIWIITNQSGLVRSDRVQDEELAKEAHHLVTPKGYKDAWSTLLKSNIVILSGASGTGRNATAKTLLCRLKRKQSRSIGREDYPALTVRELVPDWTTPDTEYVPTDPGCGYILDLSRGGGYRPKTPFAHDLKELARRLRAVGSYLIVITTDEEWTDCALRADELTIQLITPSAYSVARKHLLKDHAAPEILTYLDTAPFLKVANSGLLPHGAARLAQAMNDSRSNEATLNQVPEQFQGWRNYLSDWFENNTSVGDRARLLSAALLGMTQDADILDAADTLLEILESAHEIEGPLSGPDLSQRLKCIDADRVDGKLSLTSRRPGLDSAVLEHVWIERPKFRRIFSRWVIEISSKTPSRLSRVADQIVNLAIRHDPEEFLLVINQWGSSGNKTQQNMAKETLLRTVLDPDIGRAVREKLNDWAQQSKTSSTLRNIVADVCAHALAEEKPDVALTRLRWILAMQHDPSVAQQALVSIASSPGLAYPTLNRVIRWMDKESPLAGARGFIALMQVKDQPILQTLLESVPDISIINELRRGWSFIAKREQFREQAVRTMLDWVDEADTGSISTDSVVAVLAPVLNDCLDRTLVGQVLRTSRPVEQDGESIQSTGRNLFEAVMWPEDYFDKKGDI